VILDIDIGNSRLKWRLDRGDLSGSCARAEPGIVAGLDLPPPDRVRIASVAGAEFNDYMRALLSDAYGVTPEFAVTTSLAGNVRCGYEHPETMGVDRWLALLAARSRASGGLLVVSAGTAVTIDAVAADGQHLGGYIVPGLYMMQHGLWQGTADVRVSEAINRDLASLAPGRTTRQAVQRGLVRMLVAFVDGAVEGFTNVWGAVPRLFICGGDASILSAHLKSPHVVAVDLVLDGLAIALP
jgi:type III pantothenate kinase